MRRSRALFTLSVSLLLATVLVPPGPAEAAVTFTSTAVNQNGGNCIGVPGGSTADNVQLTQSSCTGAAGQNFTFTPVSGTTDQYTVGTLAAGKCADVYGVSTADNANIIQWTCNGQNNQRFQLVPISASGKTFNLRAVHSGKCIAPAGDSGAANTGLVQLPCSSANSRVWALSGYTNGGTTGGTYTNPLSQHGPDPWLTYYNGNYYMATTTWNSTITMRRAPTLRALASAPDTVIFNLTRPNGCCNMWAPEFHLLNGPNGLRWYLYYTAGANVANYLNTQRIHVLESAGTDPMGPYTFKADLLDPVNDNTWELDASILQLDGRLYLLGTFYNGSQPMFIRPMSNPWTASGTRRLLSTPTYSWETVGGAVNEGPEVIQRGGKTFIVFSASHCSTPDYKLGLLTYNGGDPLNSSSWVKSPNPIFQRSDANGVYGPGHNGFFTSPDGTENWIVYHANNSPGGGCDMNRTTRAQKFTWNADGTPNFGTPVPLGVNLPAPSGEPTG